MGFKYIGKQILIEDLRGHYIELLPFCKIFPKKKDFREDYWAIHVGWLVWSFHFRFGLKHVK